MDRSIVKLNSLPDTDGAGTKYNHLFLIAGIALQKLRSLILLVIGGIEIGGLGGKLRRAGVHHLIDRIEGGCNLLAGQTADNLVGEAQLFGPPVGLKGVVSLGKLLFHTDQIVELCQEPAIHLGHLMDVGGIYPFAQRLTDDKQPLIVALVQSFPQLLHRIGGKIGIHQAVVVDLRPPYRLHNRLLKGGADGHNLAGGLHLGTQRTLGIHELIEGPFGEFDHHIVQRRLKAGIGHAGDGVLDFIQRIADGDLGSNLGDGITCGLGGQRRRTGNTGIDLNDCILKGIGIEGKLAVTAAFHLQLLDDIQGCGAQHLVFLIRQRHRRGNDDGIAGMHPYRIEIFHRADGDHIVLAVPHHLKLDLFPSGNAPLHQHLADGGKPKPIAADLPQLLWILDNTAAGTAQSKGRAQNHRITDLLGKLFGALHIGHHHGRHHRLTDLHHGVLKQLTVLRPVNSLRIGSQQLHPMLFQKAFLCQLHREGQARLTSQGGKQAVRLLLLDDPFDGGQRQRFNIDFIGDHPIGHDGGRVGIDQDHLQPILFQGTAGLGTGVVKLCGLTDDDGAGTDHHHTF